MEKLTRTAFQDPATGNERDGSTARRESLLDQQSHLRPLERVHNAGLHNPGVARGLEVRATEDAAGLHVLPGVAVDAQGNHIVLAVDGKAVLGDALLTVTADGVAVPTTDLDGAHLLTIAWAETFDRETFDDSSGKKFQTDHTPRLVLRPEEGGVDATEVALAHVTLDGGVVTALAPGPRAYSTGQLTLHRPDRTDDAALSVGAIVAGTLRARADDGLDLAAADSVLSITSGRITAGGDDDPVLTVDTESGNVGLGTATPSARLQVSDGAIVAASGAGAAAGIAFARDTAGLAAHLRYVPDGFGSASLTVGVENDADAIVFERAGTAQLEIKRGEVLVTGLLGASQVSAGTLTARSLSATGDVRLGADGKVHIGGTRIGVFLQLSDKVWLHDPRNDEGEIWVRSADDSTFGTMRGHFVPPCSARFKQDIERLDGARLRAMHDDLMRTPVASFSYRGASRPRRHIGVILEDCPSYLADGDGINPVEYTALLHGALQVLSQRVTELSAQVAALDRCPS